MNMNYKLLLAGASLAALNGCGTPPPAANVHKKSVETDPVVAAVPETPEEVRLKKAQTENERLEAELATSSDSRMFDVCGRGLEEKVEGLGKEQHEKTRGADFENCRKDMETSGQCTQDLLLKKGEVVFLAEQLEQMNAILGTILGCSKKLAPIRQSAVDYSAVTDQKSVKKTPEALEKEAKVLHRDIRDGVDNISGTNSVAGQYVEGLCRYDDPQVKVCNDETDKIFKEYRKKYKREIDNCNANPPPNFEHTEGACATYVMKKKVTPYVEVQTKENTCLKMTKLCVESKKNQVKLIKKN